MGIESGLLEQINIFYQELSELKKQVLKQHRINEAQLKILTELKIEALSLKKLALSLTTEKSTLSRQVASLVKSGWLIKDQSADKRMQFISLTVFGKESLTKIEEQLEQPWTSLFHTWSEEEKQLLSILLGRVARSLHQQKKVEE